MILPPNSIIASGPVIIENNKVLLNKEKKEHGSDIWMFPGGTVKESDSTLEDACRRTVKEEMGIEVTDLKLFKVMIVKRPQAEHLVATLVHYLAKRVGEINPGSDTIEWGWHDIDKLPPDCAPNVYAVIEDYKKML